MIRTITASALAAVALAAAASAEDSVVIDITAVDFSDPAQVSAVYDKVVAAAETVCEDLYVDDARHTIGFGERMRMYAACVEATIEETIEQAEQPALSELVAAAPANAFAVASN